MKENVQREECTEVSYEKNLMADSGNIFTTDSPFPTQNARIPPSMYVRPMASKIALKPFFAVFVVSVAFFRSTLLISGERVIRYTFRRSKGAVVVRETGRKYEIGAEVVQL